MLCIRNSNLIKYFDFLGPAVDWILEVELNIFIK